MCVSRLAFAALTAWLVLTPVPSDAQSADVNAEARVFFDRGNALLEQAGRARGRRHHRLLEESLQAFVSTLRIVRSRNALFNAALVLEQLERPGEAFGYYREYLAIPGLSDVERQQGNARIDVVRPQIAIVAVASTPADVEVYVDRLDLAARGRTPLQIALPAGEHTLFFRHPHHEDTQAQVMAEVGSTQHVEQSLTARPVEVRLQAAMAGRLTLDGEEVEAGTLLVAPGPHIARLEIPGRAPSERRFELEPGTPLEVRLQPGALGAATITVITNTDAAVSIDSLPVGTGRDVSATMEIGPHTLRVQADGYLPFETVVRAEPGQAIRVRVELNSAIAERPIGIVPHLALGVTAAASLAWAGLGIRALSMKSDYDDDCQVGNPECTDAARSDVQSANLITDVMMGVAGAMAITTIILYLLNRTETEPSRADVDITASRDGASLRVGGHF